MAMMANVWREEATMSVLDAFVRDELSTKRPGRSSSTMASMSTANVRSLVRAIRAATSVTVSIDAAGTHLKTRRETLAGITAAAIVDDVFEPKAEQRACVILARKKLADE